MYLSKLLINAEKNILENYITNIQNKINNEKEEKEDNERRKRQVEV